MDLLQVCVWVCVQGCDPRRARECIPLKQYRVLSQGTVQVGRANPIVGCLFAFVFLALSSRDDPDPWLSQLAEAHTVHHVGENTAALSEGCSKRERECLVFKDPFLPPQGNQQTLNASRQVCFVIACRSIAEG